MNEKTIWWFIKLNVYPLTNKNYYGHWKWPSSTVGALTSWQTGSDDHWGVCALTEL